MKKYLLNITHGKIHNGLSPCPSAKRMKDSNKKWFDTYEEASNFYEGTSRKGEFCGRCFKNLEEALNL